jgi:RNA polymerase sigma-70 factor (ECF subfamily)
MKTGPLSRIFLRHSDRWSTCDPALLEQVLVDLVGRASAAWPDVTVSWETFIAYLAERVNTRARAGEGRVEDVAHHATDLYLACACVHGNERALVMVEQSFLRPVLGELRRKRTLGPWVDEVGQRLRERLFVGDRDSPPRIVHYNGQGSLKGWLRVAATRLAIDFERTDRAEGKARKNASVPVRALDPELALMKSRYEPEFQTALGAAFAALSSRDAAVLRLHFLQGTSAAAIGSIYGVGAHTVFKWITRSRRMILEQVRRVLQERLQLGGPELESVIALLGSKMDLTISRYLRESGARQH